MGVTYKLKDEVVQFIIGQRQGDPLLSCRQLAESASQKFGLQLSKSSVHDVLKESGIITPRGRKPKTKFEIPQERKKQIQTSLSQVKLLASPVNIQPEKPEIIALPVVSQESPPEVSVILEEPKSEMPPVYEKAGRIFLKAVLWDLGIYLKDSEDAQQGRLPLLQEDDWSYYLTYCKGIKVKLENDKEFFIDLPLPIERCIREVADGLINNVKPFIVGKVSDEALFKASMEAQPGFKINNILIVGQDDHILLELSDIVVSNKEFIVENRTYVESNEKSIMERVKALFLPESYDVNMFINNIMNLNGFNLENKAEIIVTLLIENSYENKAVLQEAVEKINRMFLRDDQDRLVKVKIQQI